MCYDYRVTEDEIDNIIRLLEESRKITLNENGLFTSIEDVEKFIDLRHDSLSSGSNIENYWEEMPLKISILKI